jgi:uncharacterized protein (DUF305 family)
MSSIRRSTCAFVTGTALALSAACGGGAPAPATAPATTEPPVSAPADAGAQHNDTDIRFAQMMIPHHQQALAMAEMALERAESPDVKALAEQIRAAQDPEIATLNGFLENWGTPPVDGEMDHSDHSGSGGMMSQGDMDSLAAASGAAFDRMFLEMMIVHHEGAVAESEREVAGGANAAAKELASQIISGQTAEIERMQQLLG